MKFLWIILFLLVNTVIASTQHTQKENNALIVKRFEIAVDKIEKLGQSEQYEEALSLCNQLLDEYQNSNEPAIEEWIAEVKLDQAISFGKLGERTKEIEAYAYIVEKYKHSKNDKVQKAIARALLFNGIGFHVDKNWDKAIIFYDQVIQKFNASNIEHMDEYVVLAMLNKTTALHELKKIDEERILFDNIIKIYQNSDNDNVTRLLPMSINDRLESMIINNELIDERIKKIFYKLVPWPAEEAVFEMLLILQNGKTLSQEEEIKSWSEHHGRIALQMKEQVGTNYLNWDFSDLENWIDTATLQNDEKQRIKKYIEIFKSYDK